MYDKYFCSSFKHSGSFPRVLLLVEFKITPELVNLRENVSAARRHKAPHFKFCGQSKYNLYWTIYYILHFLQAYFTSVLRSQAQDFFETL